VLGAVVDDDGGEVLPAAGTLTPPLQLVTTMAPSIMAAAIPPRKKTFIKSFLYLLTICCGKGDDDRSAGPTIKKAHAGYLTNGFFTCTTKFLRKPLGSGPADRLFATRA